MKLRSNLIVESASCAKFIEAKGRSLNLACPKGCVFHFLASQQKVKREIYFATFASRAKRAVKPCL